MRVETRAASAVRNAVDGPFDGLLIGCFRGFALKLPYRIEAFEDESAIITEELLHPHRTQKDDGIIIIALNPFAVTPRALHRGPF